MVTETFPSVIVKTVKGERDLALSEVWTGELNKNGSWLLPQNAVRNTFYLRTHNKNKASKKYKNKPTQALDEYLV